MTANIATQPRPGSAVLPRTRAELHDRLAAELDPVRGHELDVLCDEFHTFIADRAAALGYELTWDHHSGQHEAIPVAPGADPEPVTDGMWAHLADLDAFRGWRPTYHHAQRQLRRARTALADTATTGWTITAAHTSRPVLQLSPDQLMAALRSAYEAGQHQQLWPVLDDPQAALPINGAK